MFCRNTPGNALFNRRHAVSATFGRALLRQTFDAFAGELKRKLGEHLHDDDDAAPISRADRTVSVIKTEILTGLQNFVGERTIDEEVTLLLVRWKRTIDGSGQMVEVPAQEPEKEWLWDDQNSQKGMRSLVNEAPDLEDESSLRDAYIFEDREVPDSGDDDGGSQAA